MHKIFKKQKKLKKLENKTKKKDEKIHDFLAKHHIKSQFNLSRAPWWDSQFERIIGLTKQALFKAIWKAELTWKGLKSVILDIEITLNNKRIDYIEDDIHTPILITKLDVSWTTKFLAT